MRNKLNTYQQQLIVENLAYAEKIANRYGSSIKADCNEKCITIDDLIQEAIIGLTEAAFRYDKALGVGFTTYAFIWCRKYVLRAVRKYGTPLSVPDNFSGNEFAIRHIDALMDDVATSYSDVDDDGSPADRLFFNYAMLQMAEAEESEALRERVEYAMQGLSPKERWVLTYLYALEGEEKTNAELAAELGIMPARITQIKERAMRKMETRISNTL